MLTKADLLKPKTKKIPVDDGEIIICALSAAYVAERKGKKLENDEIFEVIADSIIDESGSKYLTGEEVGQIAFSTLEQITKAVFEFNALGPKAVDDAVNELKKTDVLTTN